MQLKPLFSRMSGFGPLARMVRERESTRALDTISTEIGFSLENQSPQTLVPFSAMTRTFQLSAKTLADPLFGFHLGRAMDAATYGPIGWYMLGAPSVAHAFHRLKETISLQSNSMSLRLHSHGAVTDMWLEYRAPLDESVQHHALHVAIPALKVIQNYLPSESRPLCIGIGLPDAVVRRGIEDALCVPVVADDHVFRVRFPSVWLCCKDNSDANPWRTLTRRCVMERLQPGMPQNAINSVKHIVRLKLAHESISLETVARDIGCSTRKLQWHLNADGTSFRDLLLELRMERAKDLMMETHLSMVEIAHMIGYSEQASFSRAFTLMEGITPGRWRAAFEGGSRTAAE